MEELLEVSGSLISKVSMQFKRYLYDRINWNDRLIGIKGARGVGKTTMLLQWLKNQAVEAQKKVYFSLDELYFTANSLSETARAFYQQGGKILVLDEVHKYPTWSQEIKNLYDRYADLQIIYTGSSIIDITRQEADLSRRAMSYELAGLSYREYLEFAHRILLPVFSLEQILGKDPSIRESLPDVFKPLEYFKAYLRKGYYPFFRESEDTYHQRLQQLIRTIVEYDMAEMRGFDIRHAKKMLQLLYVIAQEVPFKPNISSLSNKTQIHRNTLGNYLHFLHEARLIHLLYSSRSGVAGLQKPEKVYLENTNLLYALSQHAASTGTIREVFFNNQLNVLHNVHYALSGDFEVDGKYFFEIGGKNKSEKQISGFENAWIVKDDQEFPVHRSLPLWLFGFLY
jgi:predicted AAA+ superfamily ATPase